MSYKVMRMDECMGDLDTLLDKLDDYWVSREEAKEDDVPSVKPDVFAKFQKNFEQGLILFHDETPVGLSWFDVSTPYYGNITFYCIDDTYAAVLAQAATANGYFDDKIMELIIYRPSSLYRQALRSLNLIENERQRMFKFLDKDEVYDVPDFDFTLRPVTKDDIKICGELSCKGHQISKDYEMYPEMMVPSMRVSLEERVHRNEYGPINYPASLMAFDGDVFVGYVLIVEVKCWGYDKVPWVFDVVVHPDYQGKKIGTYLMAKAMSELAASDFAIIGLAVTLTNYNAAHIYEKMGYQILDTFYEFMKPVTPW